MKFTRSERKWILETIRYDVINSSYRILKESGMSTRNIKINLKNERNLLENYFRGMSLNEAKGFLGFITSIFKTFYGIVSGLIKAAIAVGVSTTIFQTAKAALANAVTTIKVFEPKIQAGDYAAGKMKDVQITSADAASIEAQGSATELVNSIAKEIAPGKSVDKVLKVVQPIASLVGKAAVLCKNILMKLGMSENLATIIAPYALAGLTVVGLMIFAKLFKMLLARIWKLIAFWKKNDKKKPENIDEEGKQMASVSLKMQQQAASKIKNPAAKKKVDQVLNKRKKMLASA